MRPRRYTDPSPRRVDLMRRAILAAIEAHPERATFEAVQSRYGPCTWQRLDQVRCAYAHLEVGNRYKGGQLELRAGRTTYRLNNNPATLTAYLDALSRSPGWTGAKTPRTPLREYAAERAIYKHADGWALAINVHTMVEWINGDRFVRLGRVLLKLGANNTLSGKVPPSWLVDLNAGPIVDEGSEEAQQMELA